MAAGGLAVADGEIDALGVQGLVKTGDAAGVARRDENAQHVGGELPLLAHEPSAGGVVHGLGVGGGEHVGGRALGQIGDEILGSLEIEADRGVGVGLFEGLGDVLIGALERCRGENRDLAGDSRAARGGGSVLGLGRRS